MKLSLFIVTLALMGCSTHHGHRKIASEPGDLITRKIQKEIGSHDERLSGGGVEVYVDGTATLLEYMFAGGPLEKSEVGFSLDKPSIPEGMIADLKLKRAFIYVKPHKAKNRFHQVIIGKPNASINGLDSLKITVNDVEILKFQKSKTNKSVGGAIYVISTEKIPQARRFLRDHAVIGETIKSIYQMKSGLAVEVIDDVVANEKFKEALTSEAESLDKVGIKEIDQCNEKNCLDLSGEEVNLLTLGKEDLKFKATVKSKKMPDEMNVDGFVEFELKMQLDGVEE